MKKLFILLFVMGVQLPKVAIAQVNFIWIDALVTGIGQTVVRFIPIVIALALLVFIWGLVKFITNSGDETAKQEGKNKMIWGVIALFIIVSIWGIVSLLNIIFGVQTLANPPSMPTL